MEAIASTAACGTGSPGSAPATSVIPPAPTADGTAQAPATPDVIDLADLPSYDYEERDLNVVDQAASTESMTGRLYVPTAAAPVPLVICCHGLVGSIDDLDPVAQTLAGLGVAAFCFAFRNGGPQAGDTTRMSVMTEVADLEEVLSAARSAADGWEAVDPQRIVFQGVSQGGAVSAITAARHPEEVAGLALWYPAFSITDDLHLLFASSEEVPETLTFEGHSLGSIYAEDMWNYDVYADMPRYPSPVLIVHGDADAVAPIGYSERAVQTFPDAQLLTIEGAGHGLSGRAWDRAMGGTAAYLQRIGVLGG
jgi:feruloyl esterase